MDVFLISACAVVGYLMGSANSALIVGVFYGVDVRKHGSGNAGTTNVLRVLGKKAALLVLIGDVAKGIGAYLIGMAVVGELGAMAAGTASILGHNWPVYFKFKGGKGALTSAAVVLMMDPVIGLIVVGVFVITVALTRYVSLGSVLGAGLFPVLALFIFNKSTEFVVFALIVGILVIIRHHANIERLLKGTESKLGVKKGNS